MLSTLIAVFFTGLTTGGLSCLALQGGLLAAVLAQTKKTVSSLWLPLVIFLCAKLFAHTLLGALLGAVGSVVSLSLEFKLVVQFLTSIFLFATAMNLLDIHPLFRNITFQPPARLWRYINHFADAKTEQNANRSTLFLAGALGTLTLFLPCGVTQAIEILAMSTGKPVWGAAILFTFVLGTMPIFAIIGATASTISAHWHDRFRKGAAILLIIMSLYAVHNIFVVLDAPFTIQKLGAAINEMGKPPAWYGEGNSSSQSTAIEKNGVQQIEITVTNQGYSPRELVVKVGVPVELTLKSNGAYSCATAFTFKKFGIATQLNPTDTQTFTFTPTEKGNFTFACSMGMYTGTLKVI